jgi:ribosomal-protein-alanine N-acetyltransferase
MTAEDLDAVLSIENEAYKKPWSRDLFERELDNPVSFAYTLKVTSGGAAGATRAAGAARRADVIAGYAIFWMVSGEAHILNVAIRADLRRRGLATLLVREVLKMMDEFKVLDVFLEVRKSNRAAIALYEKFGFRETFERKNYYGDEDAMVMRFIF